MKKISLLPIIFFIFIATHIFAGEKKYFLEGFGVKFPVPASVFNEFELFKIEQNFYESYKKKYTEDIKYLEKLLHQTDAKPDKDDYIGEMLNNRIISLQELLKKLQFKDEKKESDPLKEKTQKTTDKKPKTATQKKLEKKRLKNHEKWIKEDLKKLLAKKDKIKNELLNDIEKLKKGRKAAAKKTEYIFKNKTIKINGNNVIWNIEALLINGIPELVKHKVKLKTKQKELTEKSKNDFKRLIKLFIDILSKKSNLKKIQKIKTTTFLRLMKMAELIFIDKQKNINLFRNELIIRIFPRFYPSRFYGTELKNIYSKYITKLIPLLGGREFLSLDDKCLLVHWERNDETYTGTELDNLHSKKITTLIPLLNGEEFISVDKEGLLIHWKRNDETFTGTKLENLHSKHIAKLIPLFNGEEFISSHHYGKIVHWKRNKKKTYTGTELNNLDSKKITTLIPLFNGKEFISGDYYGNIVHWKRNNKTFTGTKLNKRYYSCIMTLIPLLNGNEFFSANQHGKLFHWRRNENETYTETKLEGLHSVYKTKLTLLLNGEEFVSGDGDGNIVHWKRNAGAFTGTKLKNIHSSKIMALTPLLGGKEFISGYRNGHLVKWKRNENGVFTGTKLEKIHSKYIAKLIPLLNGKEFISFDWNNQIVHWKNKGSNWRPKNPQLWISDLTKKHPSLKTLTSIDFKLCYFFNKLIVKKIKNKILNDDNFLIYNELPKKIKEYYKKMDLKISKQITVITPDSDDYDDEEEEEGEENN